MKLLIVGGSQGARVFNQRIPEYLASFQELDHLDIRHQCGRNNGDTVQSAYAEHGIKARVDEFIEDMGEAYRWADVVLCRAGAMTVAEVCMMGLPAIYVPFPHAAGDHQTMNAGFATARGAARLLPEHELNQERLHRLLQEFLDDSDILTQMSAAARGLARPDATLTVASHCREVMHA